MFKKKLLRLMQRRRSSPTERDERFRRIRSAMLDTLPIRGDVTVTQIAERILYAADTETLWYLRTDVMSVLSELDGEASAARELRDIDAMFEGELPQSIRPRPHEAFLRRS